MPNGATIVCLSSIDWAFNWQIPQEVAAGLAASRHRVLFVENTGIRRPGLRDAGRLTARAGNWWRARGRIRQVVPGVDLYSPILLPFPYSPAACRLNAGVLRRVIRGWTGEMPDSPLILITFLPTPLARAVAHGLEPDALVYYCADRLAESSPGARRLASHERALCGEADIVFASSTGLLKMAARYSSRATLLTSGVRFDRFESGRASGSQPEALRGLRRPIAGFVGSLRGELDLVMLARAAQLAPDVTFVLVGPAVTDVRRLAACPNVRLIGAVPHDEAIRYMLNFDAGLLPYVVNRYTTDLMPVKLKEYLAAGIPVISTGLPEVRRFSSEHGHVVALADDADSFVAALRRALESDGPALVARRLEIARRYDWTAQIARMNAAIEAVLEGSTAVASAAG